MKTISRKHNEVLDHYFEDHCKNKAEAMRKAGYSETTCVKAQHLVFNRPDVIAEMERRRADLTTKHELKLDWVVERLMDIANSGRLLAKFKKVTADGYLDWDFTNATAEELSVINELMVESYVGKDKEKIKKFKITTSDIKGALDSLARILGAFSDSMTIKGELSMVERLHAGRARVKKENLEHLK